MVGTEDHAVRRDWAAPHRTGTVGGVDLRYLDRDDPDDRRYLIEAEHPELAQALEEDLDEIVLDGEPMSPRLHILVHEVVTNQLCDNDPPEAWSTAMRLSAAGYDRHEIIHMLGSVVSTELWEVLSAKRPADRERMIRALEALPESWEASRRRGESPTLKADPGPTRLSSRRAAQSRRRGRRRRR